ncbi:hypothetical protein PGT21_032277 [Puccinia graminis f. sp. tritici]|uniref:Zinc finger CHCC-type domain-containing protein n=1 Tax=Puccinia graminis f. sp. tritici TaxID=56615 RepID=A0A5B0NPX9_PUCGR|nr:hypothetical protein PGT21_032277 [Puccinia graminis f. sp. tritici]
MQATITIARAKTDIDDLDASAKVQSPKPTQSQIPRLPPDNGSTPSSLHIAENAPRNSGSDLILLPCFSANVFNEVWNSSSCDCRFARFAALRLSESVLYEAVVADVRSKDDIPTPRRMVGCCLEYSVLGWVVLSMSFGDCLAESHVPGESGILDIAMDHSMPLPSSRDIRLKDYANPASRPYALSLRLEKAIRLREKRRSKKASEFPSQSCHMECQPETQKPNLNPLPAIELIKKEPIRMVSSRVAAVDGGGGALGHPKIFINLDKPGPQPCGYCGLRFERSHDDHH